MQVRVSKGADYRYIPRQRFAALPWNQCESVRLNHECDFTGYVQLDAELANTTCYEWDTVRLKCDISGYPLPRYRWYKDGQRLATNYDPAAAAAAAAAGRFNIKTTPWGSR